MKETRIYNCPCCGGKIDTILNRSKYTCEYCGSIVRFDKLATGSEYYYILDELTEPLLNINSERLTLSKHKEQLSETEFRLNCYKNGNSRIMHKIAFGVIIGITSLIFVASLVLFVVLYSDYDYPVIIAFITLAIEAAIGFLIAQLKKIALRKEYLNHCDLLQDTIAYLKSDIAKRTSVVERYETILTTHDEYVKMIRRTDAASLDYMKYTLYVDEAKTILEACKLNEIRIREKHKQEEEFKKRSILEQKEQTRIELEKKRIQLERERLNWEKNAARQEAQSHISKDNSDTGSIGVKEVLIGGAVVAGAVALGPVAVGVAAKVLRKIL